MILQVLLNSLYLCITHQWRYFWFDIMEATKTLWYLAVFWNISLQQGSPAIFFGGSEFFWTDTLGSDPEIKITFFSFWFLQIWDPVTGCMALSGWPDSTDRQLIITTPDSSLEHRDLTNIWCIWRIQELDSVLLFFWIVDCTSSSNGSGAVGVFVSVLLTYHNSVKSTIPHRHQVITEWSLCVASVLPALGVYTVRTAVWYCQYFLRCAIS